MRTKLEFSKVSNLAEFRKSLRLNQMNFWKTLGVTQSGGSRYENSRNIPRPVLGCFHAVYGKEYKRFVEKNKKK